MKLVVVGGVAAGMNAALEAKRVNPDLEVSVFERTQHVNFSACGLPWVIGGDVPNFGALAPFTPEDFRAKGIRVLTSHEVHDVDLDKGSVEVRDHRENRVWREPFDGLLVATGARPVKGDIEGVNLPGVYTLRSIEDGEAIDRAIEAGARRAVVVGGGYIGLVMSEAFRKRGLEVTLVEQLPRLMGSLDEEIASLTLEALERGGVTVHLETMVHAFAGEGTVQRVITGRGEIQADLVLLTAGVRPNSELARSFGVETNPLGAIRVNDRLETNIPNVWAAGDVAEAHHLVTRRPAYVPLGSTASKQGRVAGANMAGRDSRFGGIVGTTVTRAFDLGIAITGLSEVDASALDLPSTSVTVTDMDHAPFFPGASPLTVKLIYQPGDGRLLGAQIAGRGASVKRIDVIATLLERGGTVEDLTRLDLAYAPPFSPILDPLLVAAERALGQRRTGRKTK
jgi:NADPH-dependent 2,4-dienoyl-CoA reductase/sulfur reductase-like enzyme